MSKIKLRMIKIGDFLKRHRKEILLIFGALILAEVAVQIFWPSDFTLLNSKVGERQIGSISKNEANQKVKAEFANLKIVLKTNKSEYQISGKTLLGAGSYQEDKSLSNHEIYPLHWRLVPFSLLFFEQKIEFGKIDFDQEKLNTLIEQEISSALNKDPISAEFVISEKGEISIKDSSNGVKIDPKKAEDQIKKTDFSISKPNEIIISSEEIKPEISTQDYLEVKKEAESAILRDIIFNLNDEKITTTPTERAKFLAIQRGSEGKFKLVLNDESLTKFYSEIDKKIHVDAGVTIIEMVNGKENARQAGATGLEVDFDDFKQQLNDRMIKGYGSSEIVLKTKILQPTEKFNHSFTNTNEGIQAYINEVVKSGKITISYQKLSGDFGGASANGDNFMVSASTYKLFIAQFVMSKIDSGQLNWNSPVLGTNVEGCFHSMIVLSTNSCAEHWLGVYGASTINKYLNDLGYNSVFNNGPARTTANDLRKMLLNIYYGNGFSANNRARLLELMKNQVFRKGIPTGSSGSVVADKVGYLDGALNDAGIVFSPRGDYILVVMTDGQNWAKIAEIAAKIAELSR